MRWENERLLIACIFVNISAKDYQNRLMSAEFTASQRWNVFYTQCIQKLAVYIITCYARGHVCSSEDHRQPEDA